MGNRTDFALDWLPVAIVAPVMVIGAVLNHSTPLTVAGVAAAIVGCLPLAARRHVASVVFAPLVTAGIILNLWLLKPGDVVVLMPMVALFDLAQRGDRRRSIGLGFASVPCVAVSIIPFAHEGVSLVSGIVFNLLLCLLAIAAGEVMRTRQLSAQQMSAAREQETLRRVGEERLRIAHEIHDVVAHAMTAINVQAGVAAHLLERDPAHAHDALRAIKDTSGDALRDLRATLDVLRDPGQSAPLLATAGLADVEALTEGARAAGLDVSVTLDAVGDLPAPVQSTGYRIVQEALTNVVRHARARSASVRVARDGDALTIEVADDGCGAAGHPAGNGVRGMCERARSLGGTLDAAPGGDGHGWVVRARLPLAPRAGGP